MGEIAGSVFSDTVREAILEFSTSITETPQFKIWEKKLRDVANDKEALALSSQIRQEQGAAREGAAREPAYSGRQQRIEKLFERYEARPTVTAYREAEGIFRALCMQANAAVSESLGIDFASHCSRGCCG
jgi:cell fate (sporulation/competence/biofilm development) regulator YlbF (YheA/YmcA/DUF963 family)